MKKLAIIGGGAAGLAAAISAGEALQNVHSTQEHNTCDIQTPNTHNNQAPNVDICIYEASDRVGRSILATGNGRCNFSNANIDPCVYHNAAFVAEVFDALTIIDAPATTEAPATGESLAATEALAATIEALVTTDGPAVIDAFSTTDEPAAFDAPATDDTPATDDALAASGALSAVDSLGTLRLADHHLGGACTNVVQRFFAGHGLTWSQESEGRLYPYANKASSVLDVLRAGVRACGVRERVESRVVGIETRANAEHRFMLRMADGSFERADAVIVAIGGASGMQLLAPLCTTHKLRPMLGPLKTDVAPIRALDNIRVHARVSISDAHGTIKATETGELLFRKYGVSGIAVFNLSRFAESGDVLHIDLFPALSEDALLANLSARRKMLMRDGAQPCVEDFLRGVLLPLVAEAVWKYAGLTPRDAVDKSAVQKLSSAFKNIELRVESIGDPKQCQIHRGGVDVSEVNAQTLELSACSGVFVAGEALDVDAPCGGYNLHWAWSSGLLAGVRAAAQLSER